MAKKTTTTPVAAKKTAAAVVPTPAVEVTPVRNSAVPPKSVPAAAPAPARKAKPTYDDVALCAYFMWKSKGGSEFDNWIAAERQLRTV
jgi:hypothetical protein